MQVNYTLSIIHVSDLFLVIWKMHKLREEYMENVDVIALGELLIDFTNNGTSNQIQYLKQTRVGHRVMYYQCLQN